MFKLLDSALTNTQMVAHPLPPSSKLAYWWWAINMPEYNMYMHELMYAYMCLCYIFSVCLSRMVPQTWARFYWLGLFSIQQQSMNALIKYIIAYWGRPQHYDLMQKRKVLVVFQMNTISGRSKRATKFNTFEKVGYNFFVSQINTLKKTLM